MENKELMDDEVDIVEGVVTEVSDSINLKSVLKNSLIVGGIIVASVFAWERLIKPTGKKIKSKMEERREMIEEESEEYYDDEVQG